MRKLYGAHNTKGKNRFNRDLKPQDIEYAGETEREHKHTESSIQNNNTLYIGCAQRALLYKSTQTDRNTDTYFDAHNWAPTLTPKYIPSRNICSTASRFPHRSGLLLRTGLRTQFTHRSGLTDRSKPIRFSLCTADPANVELVSQQIQLGYSTTMIIWHTTMPLCWRR